MEENNLPTDNTSDYFKYIVLFGTSGFIVVLLIVLYLYFNTNIYTNLVNRDFVSISESNVDKKKIVEPDYLDRNHDLVGYAVSSQEYQYYIPNATPEYLEVLNLANQILYKNINYVDKNTKKDFPLLYKLALAHFEDTTKPPQERAYVINLFNLVYNQDFDSSLFEVGLASSTKIKAVYQKYLDENLKRQKTKKYGQVKGSLYNFGIPEKNIASQKTLAYLNLEGHKLYPNSYSLLRHLQNTIQADTVMRANFVLEKNYKNYYDYHKQVYQPKLIPYIESELKKIIEKGDLYKDIKISQFEINIMTINSLLMDKIYFAKTKGEKLELAREVLRYADHLDKIGENSQTSFPYFASAQAQVKIYNEKLLESEENERLINSAEQSLLLAFKGYDSNRFRYFLKNADQNNNYIYGIVKQLSSRSPDIKKLVEEALQ